MLSGAVSYYRGGAPVAGVGVTLVGPVQSQTTTNTAGAYALGGTAGAPARIMPSRTGGQATALSALDAAWILQAVAGSRTLDADQLQAGDVTGDGTLSTLDASLVLQHIVGLLPRLPAAERCASDWLFIPAPTAAPNQSVVAPLLTSSACTMGAIAFSPLAGQATGQDFRAVLLGDVTGNWTGP
jgi:hypothetical protein